MSSAEIQPIRHHSVNRSCLCILSYCLHFTSLRPEMQAESSLRALLRTTTQLRSICSTSRAAGARYPERFPQPSAGRSDSARPNSNARAHESSDGRRPFTPRRDERDSSTGRNKGRETYEGDFDSRLERSIQRISPREPPVNGKPRRDSYRRDGNLRPHQRSEGHVGKTERTAHSRDISQPVPRKPSFGLRRPSAGGQAAERKPVPNARPSDGHLPEESAQARATHPRSNPPSAESRPSRMPRETPGSTSSPRSSNAPIPSESQPWRPAKKLTYQAMAGLRALHANDPKTFDKDALSQRFGISYEAVNRILRSKYQDRRAGDVGDSIQGTKWDLDARSSVDSPVPAVQRAFARAQQARQRNASDSNNPMSEDTRKE